MRLPRSVRLFGRAALVALVLSVAWIGYRLATRGPWTLEWTRVSTPAAVLRYGPAPVQTLEVRVPPGRGPFPVAVLIHGGCFIARYGSPADMAPIADALLARGVASVNIGYRRVGEAGGGWPGTFRDVGSAVDGVRRLAPRFRIDPARMVVMGHSAGATLALWAASRGKLAPASDLYAARPLLPRAVVAVDGPGALGRFVGQDAELCGEPVVVPLMGGAPGRVPRRYADAEPQARLPLGVPQYLVRGALEQPDDAYVAAARASGDRVAFARPPGRPSHFTVIMPWHADGAPMMDDLARAVADASRVRADQRP